MIRILISITMGYRAWAAGSSPSNQVHQGPADLYKNQGELAKMECSHSISTYNVILWYKQSNYRELVFLGYMQLKTGFPEVGFDIEGDANAGGTSTLTIKQLTPNSSAVYYCAATGTKNYNPAFFGAGTKLTVLDPNIKVTEPTVKVLAPSAKECEDRNKKKKKTLVCVATRFYPDHVTVFWQVNNVNRTEGAGTDNRALWDKDGLYSITSRLRVPANEWHKPENRFTCIVSFYDGTDNIRVTNDTISGDLQGQSGGEITTDYYVKSTQTAKLAYSIFIAKSTFYGLVVMVMIWKFQGSSEKQI
nr:T-cell receptor beta chain [Oncorhynchus mykiss]